MGKKKTRSKYTSKGAGPAVSSKIKNSVRKDRPIGDRILCQLRSWEKGKRTMVTIENPNKNETNKRFIKIEGNDPRAFGPWKKQIKEGIAI
jgi:hypothetical protein